MGAHPMLCPLQNKKEGLSCVLQQSFLWWVFGAVWPNLYRYNHVCRQHTVHNCPLGQQQKWKFRTVQSLELIVAHRSLLLTPPPPVLWVFSVDKELREQINLNFKTESTCSPTLHSKRVMHLFPLSIVMVHSLLQKYKGKLTSALFLNVVLARLLVKQMFYFINVLYLQIKFWQVPIK